MSKRLVKIAKELNVGTATIVEHLLNNGFEIENKPTAKVTDEMYTELLKEFQKSIAIKEKADQLVIGTRPSGKKEEAGGTTVAPQETAVAEPPAPPPPPPSTTADQQEKPASEKPPVEPAPEKRSPTIKLNVKGKINLGERLKVKKQPPAPAPKKEEKPKEVEAKKKPLEEVQEKPKPKPEKVVNAQPPVEPPKAEKPKPKAKTVVGTIEPEPPQPTPPEQPVKEKEEKAPEAASKTDEAQPANDAAKPETPKETPPRTTAAPKTDATKTEKKGENLVRAQTPELRGLKILGKIDTDKFSKPKKKKKDKKEKPAAGNANNNRDGKPSQDNKKTTGNSSGEKKTTDSNSDPNRQKRKRKRKTISTVSQQSRGKGNDRGRRRSDSGRKDEVKEVSKKEIEEKIKATMARLSGSGKKKRQKLRRENRDRLRERQEAKEQETKTDKLQLTEFVSVSELASLMDVAATDVITTCMNLGVIVSINQRLDAEIIELVAEEFGHEIEFISVGEENEEEDIFEDDEENLTPRAPIVTVMGHVDHGKTSLLDYIREANVVSGEAGGITQHIGAYEVAVGPEKKRITFLDTPGHEAFTAMRARGAKVTDIAVIIIAADDSIMPQTKEAISHAQAAGVPIVFAINKVDKDGAQPEKIKQELASMNFLVEAWGGEYQSQDISAKTGLGIDELLEKILLEAEMLELKANPDRKSVGTVIEASLDKGRGYVTKMLVQTGSLHIGDPIVAGEYSGKVKAMFNERGKRVKSAGPSSPVLVLGLGGAPQAGDRFREVDSEQEARQIANKRAQITREQANRATKRISLDEIGRRLALGNFKELNLIVKGDVDGSVEALSDSLIKQSHQTVQVNVIHKAVGQIIESDVLLATASEAIIIGFQVRPSLGARKLAEREGVEIKTYSIIYEAIEELKLAIEGMLEPTKEEKIVTQVEVRNTFKISKIGTIAGCYVQEGKITRNTHIRLIRNGIVIFPTKEGAIGEISSLKRFKDDVKEVKFGMECGISIKNFNDIKVGDIIEGYEIVEIKQRLVSK